MNVFRLASSVLDSLDSVAKETLEEPKVSATSIRTRRKAVETDQQDKTKSEENNEGGDSDQSGDQESNEEEPQSDNKSFFDDEDEVGNDNDDRSSEKSHGSNSNNAIGSNFLFTSTSPASKSKSSLPSEGNTNKSLCYAS